VERNPQPPGFPAVSAAPPGVRRAGGRGVGRRRPPAEMLAVAADAGRL